MTDSRNWPTVVKRWLEQQQVLAGQQLLAVEPLPLGRCNRNFRLRTQEGDWLLRLFGRQGPVAANDRRAEFRHQQLAHGKGLAAEAVSLSPALDWMLCRFAVGRPLAAIDAAEPLIVSRIGQHLARLHRLSLPPGTMTLGQIATDYWRQLNSRASAQQHTLWRQLEPHLQAVDDQLSACCLCHQDLHPGNWVWDEAGGEMRLLDWEFAGAGNPHVDFASVFFEFDLSVDARAQVIASYLRHGGRPVDPGLLALAEIAYLALCWLWDELLLQHAPDGASRYLAPLQQSLKHR